MLIGNNANEKNTSLSYFPRSYVSNKTGKKLNQNYLTGSKNAEFKVIEWEVWKVNKVKRDNKKFNPLKVLKEKKNTNYLIDE